MPIELSILSLEGHPPAELGRVKGERTVFGRECPQGVTVATAGVSRQHAEVIAVKSQFLFRDLGSTNGSWINGEKVVPPRPRILRPGDSMQLAAAALRVAPNPAFQKLPSIIVLCAGRPVDEFPVALSGRALTLGGDSSDVALAADGPALCKFESAGGVLTVTIEPGAAVTLNGNTPTVPSLVVKDNDVLDAGEYQMVVNLPQRGDDQAVAATQRIGTSQFGNIPSEPKHDDVDATIAIERTQKFSTGGSSPTIGTPRSEPRFPATRFGGDLPQEQTSALGLTPLEIKLIILMAVVLLFAVLVFAFWWMSQVA